MENIAESIYTEVPATEELNDNPSLLNIILEITPRSWYALSKQISIQDITKSLLVFLNAHLSLNNSNQVAFILSLPFGSRFLHPNVDKAYDEHVSKNVGHQPTLVNKGMYRHFRLVDETVLLELNIELNRIGEGSKNADPTRLATSTVAGALLMALTYTNRLLRLDQSISTTTASAISSTTSAAGQTAGSSGGQSSILATSMGARTLIITANDTYESNYIAIMNSIFAAQKMKVPLDVAKLGANDSPYLQQAADATDGVYLHIKEPQGLMQVLSTAYFIDPSLRSVIILPTNSNVNYKASCFITGNPVDIGYVCSVCLCIMSIIPDSGSCPTCKSKFDDRYLAKLRRGPVIARKKRRLENGSLADGTKNDASPLPAPNAASPA